jgi:hypothetical protein
MDPLSFLLVGALLGAVFVDANAPRSGQPRLIVRREGDRTWVSGDTYVLRGYLKRLGFRWDKGRTAWALSRPITTKQIAAALPPNTEIVEVAPADNAVAFQPRTRPGRPTGHTGQVVGLPGTGASTGAPAGFALEDLLRSQGMRFGTSAPYRIDNVIFARKSYIGRDVPALLINGFGKDSESATPTVKQLAYHYADAYGLGISSHMPSVRIGRDRMVTDDNPSSSSFGKTKRMKTLQWVFEVNSPKLPYQNPENGAWAGREGFEWFPQTEYSSPHPAVVRWRRERIWQDLYKKSPPSRY